jgi:hypothetical protein
MSQSMQFCFKGNRTYVQGPDIVAALYKYFGGLDITDVDLKFNGISSTNLDLIEGDQAENAKVNIHLNHNGEAKSFQLVENGQVIDCRYDYDEQKVTQLCDLNIENKQVSLKGITNYTLCENFVAMNKYLLNSLFPEENGKWYFTRLEQKRMIPDNALISVKLIKNFNFRLTKSDILFEDDVIGSVYFTMVRA